MAYLLNIETATRNCSVSLAQDGRVLLVTEMAEEGYSHAEKLHVYIESLLQESGIHVSDLSAVAVSKGPGSYTGLRIGVSTAKGLCYALGKPLLAIDTLAVLARQVRVSSGLIVPMLDARRMEVYSAIFSSEYQLMRAVAAEIIDTNSYQDYEEPIYFIGDCQPKVQSILQKDNFHFLESVVFPSAKEMASLSYDAFQKQQWEDVAYFEPFYLKDFVMGK